MAARPLAAAGAAPATAETAEPREEKPVAVSAELAALCAAHIALNASAPILLHWVKDRNGGSYPFSGAALTFHAYGAAVSLGLCWVAAQGGRALRQVARPDMLLKFGLLAALFAGGDTLSVYSLEHLDPGTFSLVGKALAMVFAVVLSRLLLGRRQSQSQYRLLACIVLSTLTFCRYEAVAQQRAGEASASASPELRGAGERWLIGLMLRSLGVLLQSLAAVFQERLLWQEACVPFMLQQTWMGCGALATTFAAWRGVDGKPLARLADGFDDWRSLLVLAVYTLNGLAVGLMVKRLGALAKALCVPIHLGVCYLYAVWSDTSTFRVEALASWVTSTVLVVAFAVSKARAAGRPAK